MPKAESTSRAEQLAIVENLAHEKAVNPGIGELLNSSKGKRISPAEKAYLRVSRRDTTRNEASLPVW
jgi:Zn-dependent M32 family carboxypeptidase